MLTTSGDGPRIKTLQVAHCVTSSNSAPWCSGLTCHPVTVEIAGSNPVGVASSPSNRRALRSAISIPTYLQRTRSPCVPVRERKYDERQRGDRAGDIPVDHSADQDVEKESGG